jgi:hypothetical protein
VSRLSAPPAQLDGEQQLQRTVRQIVGLHQRQHGGDADAVVRAERRTAGIQVLALATGHDRVFREVVPYVGVLLLHHVEMGLQDRDRRVLAARRARFAHDDVARGVGVELEPARPGQSDDVVADPLLSLGRSRDLEDAVEVGPQALRLDLGNERHAGPPEADDGAGSTTRHSAARCPVVRPDPEPGSTDGVVAGGAGRPANPSTLLGRFASPPL